MVYPMQWVRILAKRLRTATSGVAPTVQTFVWAVRVEG